MDILQPAGRAVDQILRLAVAEHTPGDADLVPFDPQLLLALRERHRNLRHVVRLAGVGAVEDHVRHLASAQSLGRLLAENPSDGIEDVRFPAAVRADDGGHTPMEAQDGLWGKRLETNQFNGLQIHKKRGEGVSNATRHGSNGTIKNTIDGRTDVLSPQDLVFYQSIAGINAQGRDKRLGRRPQAH